MDIYDHLLAKRYATHTFVKQSRYLPREDTEKTYNNLFQNLQRHAPFFLISSRHLTSLSSGPLKDWQQAATFIKQQFVEKLQGREAMTHFVCATDTRNVHILWKETRNIFLKRALDA